MKSGVSKESEGCHSEHSGKGSQGLLYRKTLERIAESFWERLGEGIIKSCSL